MRRFVLNSESARMCLRRAATLLTVIVLGATVADRTQADTLSVRIAAGTDDAEEHFAEGGGMDLGSSDLEIGAEGGGADAQWIGLRFLDINIPRGAQINSANIQFTVDETDDEVQAEPIQIFGELGPSLTFTGATGDISSRTRTATFVNWADIPPWPIPGEAGPDQLTPNFGPVVQAIVNQGSWAPNNAMVIMLSPLADFERTAEAYNGSADQAALLTIDFNPNSTLVFGDFNDDGAVDLADFQILVANFRTGTTYAQGDFTFDGVVDLRDFIGFRQEFNAPAVAGAAVPEPAGMVLGLLSATLLLVSRRRVCRRRPVPLLIVAVFVALVTAALADRAHADTISVRVADGNDDAEEDPSRGMDLGSSDLEIGAEGGGGTAQWIGMRFLDINIPRGALINSANIQFTVDETDDEVQTMPIQIFGELGPSSAFTGTTGNITDRTRTAAFVNWENIPPWPNVGDAGPDQLTPNFGSVVQTIVNQSTWTPNNAMVIMLSPHANFERTAEAFNGSADQAALLTIDFNPNSIILFGDFNFDGAIDTTDFQILVTNFNVGTTFAEGDFTFDGIVDFRDFVGFRKAFEAAAVGGAAVPEPSAMILAAMALAGFAGTFRRRR